MSVYIDSKKCTGCGICIPICPEQATSIIQNKAVIDDNKCTECLQCMHECPTNAIYQVSDKEISVIERENSIPQQVNLNGPQPKQTLWSERQKQQPSEFGDMFLSGLKRLANNLFRNEPTFGRRKGGRGKRHGRHGRGYGRGRH